jgi:hypothetical protein
MDCNTNCGYLTSCCPALATEDCLQGCQQNPNQPAVCAACFEDTSCGTLDTCVVANCGLPPEVCYGTP